MTLDLNGHTLRYQNAAVSGSVIIVSSGAELTVTDSSTTTENSAGNGKISGGAIVNGSSGTVVLSGSAPTTSGMSPMITALHGHRSA